MVMAYIIFVNPSILGTLVDSAGERLAISAVLTMTCICVYFCLPVVSFWMCANAGLPYVLQQAQKIG